MRISDNLRAWCRDAAVAFALLTRLPLPHQRDAAFERQANSVWAFPVVGAVIGAIATIVGVAALAIGLPPSIAAGLVIACQIVMTGAMHEDGLADTADGIWGGWTPQRRLEIMKDSMIGAYGTLALILSVGLRWTALAVLLSNAPGAVIAAAAISRSLLPLLMIGLPHARTDGLSQSVGAPGRSPVAASVVLGLAIGWAVLGPAIAATWIAAALVVLALALLARARIGGQTGDILGAAQQLAEIAILLTLLVL